MFRKQRGCKTWTPKEIDKLKILAYEGVLPKDMEVKLGRTKNAIYAKASKLNIKLPRTRTRPPNSGRKISMPETGHRLIIEFFQLVIHIKRPLKHVLANSGYCYNSIQAWKHRRRMPRLASFEDILNCIGFKLIIVPIDMNYGDVVNFVTHVKESKNASSKSNN